MRSCWITPVGPNSNDMSLQETKEDNNHKGESHVMMEAEIRVTICKPKNADSHWRLGTGKEQILF